MREPIREIRGVMAVMPISNINTDAIIPSAWLRTATADFGKGLFGGHRYDETGRERPDFVLNRTPFRTARMLLADENFGCGSSREAAVWALMQYGIRCVLAPSFADIFYENSFRNGLLAGLIDIETFHDFKDTVEAYGENPEFTVDLPSLKILGPDGKSRQFRLPASRIQALMRGDDEIAMTLRHENAISTYYAEAKAKDAWLYPAALQSRGNNT